MHRLRIWWLLRRHRPRGYRINLIDPRMKMGPGFMASLKEARFWESGHRPQNRSRRLARQSGWLLLGVILALLVWVLAESIRALRIF